jgi:PAS domain S-box-containing protein
MRSQTEAVIGRIATSLSSARGSGLFDLLCQNLSSALSADLVFLAEQAGADRGSIRALSAYPDGLLAANFQCQLAGTACGALLEKQPRAFDQGVRGLFPLDRMLADLGAEAFAGVPLLDAKGEVRGVLAAVFRCALPEPADALAVQEVFAARAAAELERLQTEQALRESEQRYKDFISHSSEGVWRIELEPPVSLDLPKEEIAERFFRDGSVAELNDAFARIFGYTSAEELRGLKLNDIEFMRDRYPQVLDLVRQGLPTHQSLFKTPDRAGEFRWLERYAIPIVDNGKLVRVWGITRDVTERQATLEELKESEERYRTLFETAGDAIFVGRDAISNCNSRALELFRASSREEIVGRAPWELSPEFQPDGSHSHEQILERIAGMDRQLSFTFEWQSRRMDGSLFDSEVTFSSFILAGERHWLALVKDITERKKHERQMEAWNEQLEVLVAERTAQLEAARQELEAFSYSVSHDLRAAIRGIQTCTEIVLEEHAAQIDEAGRQWLQYIREDTNQLDKLTKALLDLARLSRTDMHRTEVDLTAICQAAAQRLTQAEPARPVQWKIAEGLQASGDAVLLRVVMENLIGNAWKFSKPVDSAVIEVGSSAPDGAGPVYFVRDNGVGFDMRNADRLFGAFQRLHQPADFEGSGIGLATVRRIVNRHGGRVWAEGAVGKGAIIFFTLQTSGRPYERATSGVTG